MARRTAARSPRSASRRRPPPTAPPQRIARLLRTTGAKLRDIAIGLAAVAAVSFIPASATTNWPEGAQRALAIAHEVRELIVDLGDEMAREGALWVHEAVADLAQQGGERLTDGLEAAAGIDLSGLVPDLGRLLPDLGDLLGDWWPQPSLPAGGGDLPRVAGSFANARELLYQRIERGRRATAYCGCAYNRRRRVTLESCGLGNYQTIPRARRVEAEHVFPAAQFGNFRRCWRQPEHYRACTEADGGHVSGRECCLRVDPSFVVAHNDLHNLIPAVGLINGERRDYRWGLVPGGSRYGDCGIRIDSDIRRVQPPDALRGDIARVMLYMRDTYGFQFSRQEERLYRSWNNLDPPDAWEIKRQRRIARLQGMENRYVVDYRQL